LIVMLLAGSGGGYFLASDTYTSQVETLEGQLSTIQQQLTEKTQMYTMLNDDYQTLSQQAAALQTSKTSLQSSYDTLQTSYNTLEADHNSLQADYEALLAQYDTLQGSIDAGFTDLSVKYVNLKKDYDDLSTTLSDRVSGTPGDSQMYNNYYQLTLAVRSLNSTLWQYINEDNSFKRTLTTTEVLKMENPVRTAIGSSTNDWTNYQKIHEYVTTNVNYVYDVEFPYITYYSWLEVNGVNYLTDFTIDTIQNHVQTPEFTLQNKQGDCDDQAALEYAMLRYYNKYIVGSDYSLYIAVMNFSDGSGHVAVFMPVSGGQLTILDPAGRYLTVNGSTITAKSAAAELESYNIHWSGNGSITKIQLYRIDMMDGSYTKVIQGTRAQVASYLATH